MSGHSTPSRRAVLRALRIGAGGVAAGALLGACGISEAEDQVVIEMTELKRFRPATVTLRRGGQVTWRNASTIQHTATSDPALAQGSYPDSILPEGAEPWDSGNVDPGETWARRFERLGTYIFFCQIHEQVGMIGTITVTEE